MNGDGITWSDEVPAGDGMSLNPITLRDEVDELLDPARIAPALAGLRVPISSLNLDPKNARKHGEANLAAIRDSLQRFGQRLPVVVQAQGRIVRAGNGRIVAAQQLGWESIAAVIVDESDVEATAFALADNRSGELAEWDDETLRHTLAVLEAEGAKVVGWTDKELAGMLRQSSDAKQDAVPAAPKKAIAKLGQLWALGRHRVLCGDSTSENAWRHIPKGGIVFTSPPYVDLRDYGGADLGPARMALAILIGASYSSVQVVNLGLVWRDGAVLPYWNHYIEAAERGGHKLLSWNVWHKTGGMSVGALTAMFTVTHEWLFVFGDAKVELHKTQKNKHAGAPCAVQTDRDADGVLKEAGMARKHPEGTTIAERRRMDSVLELAKVQSNEDHPATFPVELPAQFLVALGDIGPVVDPFLGSGTTLIAADQLGHTCYGIEIEPRYVDVTVRRWEKLTGEKASVVDIDAGGLVDLLS